MSKILIGMLMTWVSLMAVEAIEWWKDREGWDDEPEPELEEEE